MRCLSLKAGLSWLIGVVLLMTLLINVSILVMHAGPRIRAEDETSLRLTRELVLMAIASLQETGDPAPALRRLYESLGSLRHVKVRVLNVGDPFFDYKAEPNSQPGVDVPKWFVEFVDAPQKVLIVSVTIKGVNYGQIAIASNPIDELAEIWSDVSWLASISILATSIILAVVLAVVRYVLQPFDGLRKALADLEAGKRNVRVASRGAREFQSISVALNSLAATLDRMKTENRALMKELILVQDNERKDIARDLHDEAGPCLFSIRAGAVKLNELISGSTPDLSLIQEICANVNRASEALQTLFHGLLGRLRPRGLHEFGLSAALKSLTMSWSVAHPEVELELNCPHDLSSLDEVVSLTAYRVVQEAVTNIFRHAKANRAQIKVEFGSMSAAAYDEPDAECQPTLQITIEDNGVGIAEQGNFGFGLIGMSERVEALGGRIAIENRSAGGTRVAVSLPLSGSVEEAG